MRLLILVSFVTLASCLSFGAIAQDEAAKAEIYEVQPTKNQPPEIQSREKTEEPSNSDSSETADPENENFDLDSFFKQGEENSKKGFGCQRAPDPIS